MIYNYLLYKGYKQAQKSEFWSDTPVLFASIWVCFCFLLNFYTLFFLVDKIVLYNFSVPNEFIVYLGYLLGAIVGALIFYYYRHDGRWRKILDEYEQQEEGSSKSVHPIIVIVLAIIISFMLATIAAMYRNGDLNF